MAGERGLVISYPIEVSNTAGRVEGLDLQELRMSLLFWDKLDFPANNVFHFGLDPECQFLKGAGILSRTNIPLSGGNAASVVVQAHLDAFRILDAKEPGVWSLSNGRNAISFPEADLEQGRGVLVSLHRAIPVPDKEVPLQDVLEFRAKRRAELMVLRHHLEDIYERVISAADGALAMTKELESLQRAIDDHTLAKLDLSLDW
jgi:hypothetical protein